MHIYTYTYTYMYIYSILILCNTMDSILKSRDITLSTKVRLVKAMIFPVIMQLRKRQLEVDMEQQTGSK